MWWKKQKEITLESEDIVGFGNISLKTYRRGNTFETIADYSFRHINTEGTIQELQKIIDKLRGELKVKNKGYCTKCGDEVQGDEPSLCAKCI